MSALHDAAKLFTAYGYDQFLAHQSVGWRQVHSVGRGDQPLAVVGVLFDLKDDGDTEMCSTVSLWLRDNEFVLTADVTVDDPLPIRGGSGNQRLLRDLLEVRTTHLDECLGTLHDYTVELCAYASVLDELGVPRTKQEPQSDNASS